MNRKHCVESELCRLFWSQIGVSSARSAIRANISPECWLQARSWKLATYWYAVGQITLAIAYVWIWLDWSCSTRCIGIEFDSEWQLSELNSLANALTAIRPIFRLKIKWNLPNEQNCAIQRGSPNLVSLFQFSFKLILMVHEYFQYVWRRPDRTVEESRRKELKQITFQSI